jgi:hypothetical protein
MQVWSHPLGKRGIVELFSAQVIDYDIGLAGMVVDSEVIIIN